MTDAFLHTDFETGGRLSTPLSLAGQRVTEGGILLPKPARIIVLKKQDTDKTLSKHDNGLSRYEYWRLHNSIHFMSEGGWQLFWAILGDDLLDMQSGEARKEIDAFLSQLVLYQGRAGLPKYYTRVFEATGGLHCNVVFPGTEKIARSLCSNFSPYMRGGYGSGKKTAMKPVYGAKGLAGYLSKEMANDEAYALGVRRLKGVHSIEGSGDRVRLSDALKADGIAAGRVEPWKESRAKRKPFMPAIKNAQITLEPAEPQTLPKPMGQLLLFPELAKPVSRLKDFHGGIIPPSVALELEYRRRQAGLSQAELGKLASTSQPQISNAIDGRFGMSRQTANRIKQVLGVAA